MQSGKKEVPGPLIRFIKMSPRGWGDSTPTLRVMVGSHRKGVM